MNNQTILLKVKQRLNKLASFDNNNFHDWQVVEAFNKGMVAWCRRQLAGTNLPKTGDEASKRRIDDLQLLLNEKPFNISKKDGHYISSDLPSDYFEWKRLDVFANKECCPPRKMKTWLVEEGNIIDILRDVNKNPNYEWAETVCTLIDNKIKIYTDNKFTLFDANIIYYRQPTRIEIQGVLDPYSGVITLTDVLCEFKDDIAELLVDECVKILAGDIESIGQNQIADNSVEQNN
jgi:hypothetical protein